jgi:predicted nucleic acid-binding protein
MGCKCDAIVPTNDLCIAATAMQHGLSILTTDERYRDIWQAIVMYFEPEKGRSN